MRDPGRASTVGRLTLLCILAAGCDRAGAASGSRAPLVNGAPSTEAAVVAVIHTRPAGTRQLCTGTLVTPTVVLTAKHCVFEDMGGAEWVPNPASSMSISLGDSVSAPTGEIGVTAIATTPGPYHDGDGAIGGDIALLTLSSAAPGIVPVAVAAVAPTEGLALRIVGFGYTGAGSTGALGDRNGGSASIVSVAAGTFSSEGASWTCTGDSGGPAFRASDGAVIGVTSIGPRGCPASTGIYTRLDAHRDLLLAAGVDVGEAPTDDAGSPTADAGPGVVPDAGGGDPPAAPSASCGCRAARRDPTAAIALAGLALLVASAGRRARRGRPSVSTAPQAPSTRAARPA